MPEILCTPLSASASGPKPPKGGFCYLGRCLRSCCATYSVETPSAWKSQWFRALGEPSAGAVRPARVTRVFELPRVHDPPPSLRRV